MEIIEILLFAGTTEGRHLAQILARQNIRVHVCVATEFGKSLIEETKLMTISSDRLNLKEIKNFISQNKVKIVIDATHPFALEISENVKTACNIQNIKYIRLSRNINIENIDKNYIYVNSIDKAVDYLKNTKGNIFITTGSKELDKFTILKDYKDRIYARVLSNIEAVQRCHDIGIEGKHLICMQGTFSEQFNSVLLKEIHAKFMVTKQSGIQGGFFEKVLAAQKLGITTIIIGNENTEVGYTYEEVLKILNKIYQFNIKRKITILGIGVGNEQYLTLKAKKAIEESDAIIGARRILESLLITNQAIFNLYKPQDILNCIENHPEFENIVIAFSGDIGFFSGASGLYNYLKDYDVKYINGISSQAYFLGKLKIPMESVKFISFHGNEKPFLNHIRNNNRVFAILGKKDDICNICKKLLYYEMDYIKITIGENLSYNNEKIYNGYPKDFVNLETSSLCVILFENEFVNDNIISCGINDNEFIRTNIPMTKSEVRSIILSKLQLKEKDIIYDIGAGTGSISIEAALQVKYGMVYAIEMKKEAISLIEKNKKKFKVDNVEIIEGIAPNILKELPIPNCAFIGGSKGNLKEIIKFLKERNNKIRIVISAITLETILQALEAIKEYNIKEYNIININISKNKLMSHYNMMIGENPIYIITMT